VVEERVVENEELRTMTLALEFFEMELWDDPTIYGLEYEDGKHLRVIAGKLLRDLHPTTHAPTPDNLGPHPSK
jgi:hypothetical protein